LAAFLLLTAVAGEPCRALGQSGGGPEPASHLQLKPGDHISIIGNTLADRMQHDGWLETYLTARYPKHDLTATSASPAMSSRCGFAPPTSAAPTSGSQRPGPT
jgi:hypothetical protein